tara:strand:+ start:10937 stop:11440 length:504 start_codon:yes stop_codon:yes gene_type:complete
MIRIYLALAMFAIIGSLAYGAKYYYDTTQNKIAILTKNNANLKVAVDTAEASLKLAKEEQIKMSELNNKLQNDLQKAEKYGDSLRSKLAQLNLVKDALTDAKNLEGRMNGATAKIWREIMGDTGGDSNRPNPNWLQRSETTDGNKDGDKDRKDNDTSSTEAETSSTQ